MTWRTSEVELCCSSASRSSRRRRAISVSRVVAERRWSAVLGALRQRFGADAARLRNLPVLPPALERRFIALSRPGTGHRSGLDRLPGSGPLRCAECPLWSSAQPDWIIGFPPGGGADIVARILGAWLAERIGQQVIVENRPGAGTNIATEYVVHSAPDGYTLLWAGVSNAINASIFSDLSFDFLKDIAPVSGVVAYPLVIEVNPQVPAMNIAELIALAKASPGKLTLASYGTGTISQVAGELFKLRAGIEMVHIPYKGGAPMLTNLLSGHVNAAINVVASDLPHIRSGAVRALATLGSKRLDALPDVPTLAETFPGYEAVAFTGVGVPRGTPPEVIARLNREINAGLATRDSVSASTISP
jgi:tripartite-type tricarboxylate transporter receptor subunit TctC